jgi:hypothetical protein
MMNLKEQIGQYEVSTVALPFAHGLDLYETMVFDKDDHSVENYTARYKSYDEAEAGHESTIDLVRQLIMEKYYEK